MATKTESTEVSQQKKVYVKSDAVLDEMEANGQLEPFTDYYTPDEIEEAPLTRTEVNTNMLGVPSNDNWVDIAIQNSEFYYTAPTNGYIRWVGQAQNNTGCAQILNIGKNTAIITRNDIKCGGSSFNYSASGKAECITCPCKAGDNIYIYLYFTSNETLKFIPAEEVQ